MVAINEILLRECAGEGCGGDNDICTDSLVHHRNAENRAPVTRNRRRTPSLGRWMEQDAARYIDGANTCQFVNSPPEQNPGNMAEGNDRFTIADRVNFQGWEPQLRRLNEVNLESPVLLSGTPAPLSARCSRRFPYSLPCNRG